MDFIYLGLYDGCMTRLHLLSCLYTINDLLADKTFQEQR